MAGGSKKKPKSAGKKKGSGRRPFLQRITIVMLIMVGVVLTVLTVVHLAHDRAATTEEADMKRHLPASPRTVKEGAAKGGQPQVAVKEPEKQRGRESVPSVKTGVRNEAETVSTPSKHTEEYREVGTKVRPPAARRGSKPAVAIIVDDLGADLDFLRELLSLNLAVTPAILPNVPHAAESATLAHKAGLEVILHIPMEPKDYPTVDPGSEPLLTSLPRDEIQRRMKRYLEVVPHVVGGNNHMGSRFSEDVEGMEAVLEILKGRGLYFVDSRTTAASAGYEESRRMRLKSAERDLFLDNTQTVEAIREQLQQLAAVATERGQAIGICHPHPEVLAALRAEAPRFKAAGIAIVPASRLVAEPPL